MSKSMSLLSALLCTFIWGTTFIAQDTGMDKIGPLTFNAVRFFVGFLSIIPFALLFEKNKIREEINNNKGLFFRLFFWISLFLFLGTYLQQAAYFILTLRMQLFLQFFTFQWFQSFFFLFILNLYIGVFGHQYYFV